LKIKSEDSLYDIVSKQISSDFRYFELIEFVRFEFLSLDCFRLYFETVSNSFEHSTLSHWLSLQSRLLFPVTPLSSNDRQCISGLLFEPSSPLSGIIAHLTSRHGRNVHDVGVMSITANRPVDDHPACGPKNAVDLGTNSYFHSVNEPNQSICFDFKALQIRATHYTVCMLESRSASCHLKNWVIEGSNEGISWTEIDRRENNTDLNISYAIKTFVVKEIDRFSMICLRQIGLNHEKSNYQMMTTFEVFGWLLGAK
jgi:hypothetical protein